MFKLIYTILLLAAICTGCRLGPSYNPPRVEVPDTWKHEPQQPEPSPPSPPSPPPVEVWWEVFGDPTLNCLEDQAVTYNPNLMAAIDRVAQARAIAGVDRSALYPQISLAPTYTNQAVLFKLYLPPGTVLPFGTNFPTIYRIHQLQYTMPINMSYEIDLWGKLRGQYESAVFNVRAQEENFHVALLTLTTDVAVSYFKMRAFDAQLNVIESNIDLLKRNLALTQSRFNKGLVSEQDVLAAQQEVSDNEAILYDTIRQRELQVDAIATLAGMPASELCLERMPLTEPPPTIPAGIPSSIMVQRPDIAAAERTMASQHALIGVAYAAFFPSLELTGALGFSSPDLRQFLAWKSRLWAIGMNALQPIFTGGYNQANLNLAYAQYNETMHDFQQQVLTAMQEVEDSLVNVEMQAKQYDSYAESTVVSEKRARISLRRYENGLTNYLEVLDSERSRLAAESNLVNVLGFRYISTIQLIKALGGTWSCE